MIKRLKQWLCRHDYHAVVTFQPDKDIERQYGIKRDVPVSHENVCTKCTKRLPLVVKTYVYISNPFD